MLAEPADYPARIARLPGIKAVLFDIYGTLFTCGSGEVGSLLNDRADSAHAALLAAGFKPTEARAGRMAVEFLKRSIALDHEIRKRDGIEFPEVDIREIWNLVLNDLEQEDLISPHEAPDVEMLRQSVEQLAVEYECRVNPAWPMPGMEDMMDSLRRCGLKLGVVSNAQFYTRLLFEALPGADWKVFDGGPCVLSYELREAKPSMRLFREALESLAVSYKIYPAETLFVGNDMLNDVTTAATAGCRTALFAGDAKSLRLRKDDPRCYGVRPDVVITSLSQLKGILL